MPMFRRRQTVSRTVAFIALFAASADDVRVQAAQSETRTVKLSISTKTWRSVAAYDVREQIVKQLRDAGLTLLERDDIGSKYALAIQYEEHRGPTYTGATGTGSSTFIACDVRLEDSSGRLVWSEKIEAGVLGVVGVGPGNIEQKLYDMAIGFFETDLRFRYLGRFVLLRTGQGEELDVLTAALNHPDGRWDRIPVQAVERLKAIGQPAVPALMNAATHRSWAVRKAAVGALGALGDSRAIVLVTTISESDDVDLVRDAAKAALVLLKK
jgi:hypothetical protein